MIMVVIIPVFILYLKSVYPSIENQTEEEDQIYVTLLLRLCDLVPSLGLILRIQKYTYF